MLRNWEDPGHGPVLRAVLQIAGNEPATREKLRIIIERSMMGLSAQVLDESERLERSGLVASQLMGLTFMRYVWKIEPIATMAEDDLVTAIAPTIQRYLDGNTGHDAAQLQHRPAPHAAGSTPPRTDCDVHEAKAAEGRAPARGENRRGKPGCRDQI
jgi:hypothetical protein